MKEAGLLPKGAYSLCSLGNLRLLFTTVIGMCHYCLPQNFSLQQACDGGFLRRVSSPREPSAVQHLRNCLHCARKTLQNILFLIICTTHVLLGTYSTSTSVQRRELTNYAFAAGTHISPTDTFRFSRHYRRRFLTTRHQSRRYAALVIPDKGLLL